MIHNGTTYDLTGPKDAPVVVLIHGLGLTRAVWQWLLPDLKKLRVLTYDLIGHGETAPPEGDPSLKDLADQLAQLLDHLEIENAAIVGFSSTPPTSAPKSNRAPSCSASNRPGTTAPKPPSTSPCNAGTPRPRKPIAPTS
jgi:Alpha/beta hydrolase family